MPGKPQNCFLAEGSAPVDMWINSEMKPPAKALSNIRTHNFRKLCKCCQFIVAVKIVSFKISSLPYS